MPLGQAPYGSRQTPPDEEPPDRGASPFQPGRWVLGLSIVVMLAFVAARGGRSNDRFSSKASAGPVPCLTDRSCADGWRCFVVPKDDPFATEGECAQACEGDLQCPSRFKCLPVAVTKERQVVPIGARGATEQKAGVCRACGPAGCDAPEEKPPEPPSDPG